MRLYFIGIIILTYMIYGCNRNPESINHFSSNDDYIKIKTKKEKGWGMFLSLASGGQIYFKDTIERYDYPVIFPQDIRDIKLAWDGIDNNPFYFNDYKNGAFDTLKLFNLIDEKKLDTLNVPSLKENSISIMCGRKGEDKIFIVDENNNKNFRDDSIRPYQRLSANNLIKCQYKMYNGEKIADDSSWLAVGTFGDETLNLFVAHHLETTFYIDSQVYKIGVVNSHSGFNFSNPVIAVFSENVIKKDTLVKKDFIYVGEYLKLNNNHYRFAEISNNGNYIILKKEKDFENKIGLQLGMIAPEFKFKSVDGNVMSSSDLRNKPLVVANISGCNPESYEKYKKLIEANKGEINTLGIEYGLTEKLGGIMLDAKDEFNLDVYNKYRQDWTSYCCYLIGKNGRIIDKFDIFDWESSLSNYLN